MIEAINSIDLSTYKNKPVIIKGCTNKKFKKYFYSLLIDKIQPVAKSIMFGEACSSVPYLKQKNENFIIFFTLTLYISPVLSQNNEVRFSEFELVPLWKIHFLGNQSSYSYWTAEAKQVFLEQ